MDWTDYDQLPASIKILVLNYFEDHPLCKTEADVRQKWNQFSDDERLELIEFFGEANVV